MPKILVGINRGEYVFNKTAKTITFSNMGDVKLEQIRLVTNVTDNVIIYQFNKPAKGGTLTTNVLTLDYDTSTMDDADILAIDFNDIDLTLDNSLGSKNVTELAPAWGQNYSDIFLNETDLAIGVYRKILPWVEDDVATGSIHIQISANVEITIWASNNSNADETSDLNWVDVSNEIMAIPSLSGLANEIYFIDTKLRPEKLMVKYETTNASNTVLLNTVRSKT